MKHFRDSTLRVLLGVGDGTLLSSDELEKECCGCGGGGGGGGDSGNALTPAPASAANRRSGGPKGGGGSGVSGNSGSVGGESVLLNIRQGCVSYSSLTIIEYLKFPSQEKS